MTFTVTDKRELRKVRVQCSIRAACVLSDGHRGFCCCMSYDPKQTVRVKRTKR